MILLTNLLVTLLISFFLVFICKKKSILVHNIGEIHQNFIKSEQTPLIGGIIFFIYFLLDSKNLSFLHLFLFLILFVGILSDSRKIISAKLRLLIQFFIVLFFITSFDLSITTTRINILDLLLNNYYLSILFTALCVLIIINGINFIDGSNLIAIGYLISIELVFIILNFKGLRFDEIIFSNRFIAILVIIFFLNAFNKLYIGDGGSYLFGFIFSFKCISLYNLNPNLSPFFIAVILWYPAFEIFFSILRKLNFNRSPLQPDSNHLHQLIYLYLSKKISNDIIRSGLVGIILNICNLIIFLISLTNIYNSQFQIILLIFSIFFYVFVYIRLLRFKLKKNF